VKAENIKSDVDLIDLDGCVNDEREVGQANTDNLNGVGHAERIPNHDQLV
jgi:hypothetical protein